MRESDLQSVRAIEVEAYDFPWSRVIFRDCLRAGYTCVAAMTDDGLQGYSVMSVAANESHILNLCVRPQRQGRGDGRRLLNYVIGRAYDTGVDTMFLEVRPSNQAALALYHSAGFNQIGVRRDYYPTFDGREDALVLARALIRDAS